MEDIEMRSLAAAPARRQPDIAARQFAWATARSTHGPPRTDLVDGKIGRALSALTF